MSVQVLHIADLHLDTPFKSLGMVSKSLAQYVQNATYTSLERLIDIAIEKGVDAVLIVGDAFNRIDPSIRAQLFLNEQLSRLIEKDIAVVFSFGNHDFYTGKLLVELPKEVHVLNKEVTTVKITTTSKEVLAVSGFSYHQKHVEQVCWEQFPKKQAQTYHIGMLHGQFGEGGGYAPFTVQQLATYGYDYWALGHIHQRQIVSQNPLIAYSGNIQGLHINEIGHKGGYLVTLTPSQTQIDEVDTAPIIWVKEQLVLHGDDTLQKVLMQIKEIYAKAMRKAKYQETLFFIRIDVRYDESVSQEMLVALQQDDILEWGQQKPCYLVGVKCIAQIKHEAVLLDDALTQLWENMSNHMSYDEIQESLQLIFQNKMMQQHFQTLLEDFDFLKDVHEESVTLVNGVLGGEMNEN